MFEHEFGYVQWLTARFYEFTDRMGWHLDHSHKLDHVWMSAIIFLFFVLFFGFWKKRYKVYPTFVQQVLEVYFRYVQGIVKDMIGHGWERYFPLIGTLGLFILFSNLLGLIPIFKSPTSSLNVTFACAITIFVYYHAHGIRQQGLLKYLKHFAGPVWWLAWLFIPVELIGHFSRPLSLSVRLFGNIFGEDTILAILFMLVPFFVPLPLMCLAIFTSLVQTLVFVMLSCVYIAGAIAHEESHGDSSVGGLEPEPAH